MPLAYCCLTPATATASAHSLRSAAINDANSAGVMPEGSAPNEARRSRELGVLGCFGDFGRDLVDDRLRRGDRRHQAVPGHHVVAGKPASATVGTLGAEPRACRSIPPGCGSLRSLRAAGRRTGWRTWWGGGRRSRRSTPAHCHDSLHCHVQAGALEEQRHRQMGDAAGAALGIA